MRCEASISSRATDALVAGTAPAGPWSDLDDDPVPMEEYKEPEGTSGANHRAGIALAPAGSWSDDPGPVFVDENGVFVDENGEAVLYKDLPPLSPRAGPIDVQSVRPTQGP